MNTQTQSKSLMALVLAASLVALSTPVYSKDKNLEAETIAKKAMQQKEKGNMKQAVQLLAKAAKKAENPKLRDRLVQNLKEMKMYMKKKGHDKRLRKGLSPRLPKELRIKLMHAQDDETLAFINTSRQKFNILIEEKSDGEYMRLVFVGQIKPMKDGLYEIIFDLKLDIKNSKHKESQSVRLSGSTRLKQGQAETVAKIPSGSLRLSLE